MTGSSGGQQINDLFDRFVSPMIGGLEAAVGSVLRIGRWWKRTAQPLMEEHKQQGDLNALQGEAVSVAVAVALQQPMRP